IAMTQLQHLESLEGLLKSIDDGEFRELCIEAMRRSHRRSPNERRFDVRSDIGDDLGQLLAARGLRKAPGVATEIFGPNKIDRGSRDFASSCTGSSAPASVPESRPRTRSLVSSFTT